MLVDVLSVALVLLLGLAIPVLVAIGLLWLARRRFSGRRGRFDRLFSGVARGGAMYSHLNAATPDPDELAVPLADRPTKRRRRPRA